MRVLLRYGVFLAIILVVMPSIIVAVWGWWQPPPPPLDSPFMVNIYSTRTGQVVSLPLEEYVAGVVAAEMPALFAPAALEAQAIAARTYVVRRARQLGGGGCSRHQEADVCDDPAHCQAYLSEQALQLKWGMMDFGSNLAKIQAAVRNTAGKIITYRGRPIDPIYHSTCGGRTEYAENVWSNSYPYLSGRECAFCTHSNRFTEERRFASLDFIALLRQEDAALVLATRDLARRPPPIQILRRSASGRVQELRVGNRQFSGTTLRRLLGLRSTNFTVSASQNEVIIVTRGHGHGVGMCQWGADGLARAGKDHTYILKFYYGGVSIVSLAGR